MIPMVDLCEGKCFQHVIDSYIVDSTAHLYTLNTSETDG